ncbi:MAG: histidine kinase [Paenibacillaceae bacterium]
MIIFKAIGNIRIKSQLLILISISISVIVLLQIIFLNWFSLINRSNTSEFLKDTTNQLELRAISFSNEVNRIAINSSFNNVTYQFIETEDIGERLRLSKNIQVMIEAIKLSNKSISEVIIADHDLISIGANKIESFWVLKQIKELYKAGDIQIDQPTHLLLDGHESGKPFYVCVTKSYNSSIGNKEFITVVIYNVDTFIDTVSNIQPNNRSVFIILDAKDNIVATNSKELEPSYMERINAIGVNGHEGSINEGLKDKDKLILYQRSVSSLNWRVIGLTPDIEIDNDLTSLKQFSVLMVSVVIVVLLGFGLIINKSITAPITRMARFMNSIGKNYSTRRLDIQNANELSLLARVLNKMLDNIDDMTNKVVSSQEMLHKAELAKKHAQFSALQSQVNPHFLYNTLDCIRSIALARGVTEIFQITTSMAKIFRYSIKENNEVEVCVEIECIQDYFKIIQIRQRDRFTIIYEVEKALMDCMIPKMILQPVVENAVFHGLEQKKGNGTLIICGYAISNNTIFFSIKDDGKGMTPDVVSQLRANFAAWDPLEDPFIYVERKSIGLINIDRRIKLLYGAKYGLSVNSSQDGTEIVIKLPLIRKNQ